MELRNYRRWEWAAWGAMMGGTIASVGYLALRPEVSSLPAFLMLRMGVGAVVAALMGPVILRWSEVHPKDG